MTKYTAKNLEEVAATFEMYSDDQIASQRFQRTEREKMLCRTRASVWKDAANILRNLTLTGEK